MCGRYYFDEDFFDKLIDYAQIVDENVKLKKGEREVFPTQKAPILIPKNNKIYLTEQAWGYPGFKAGQSIINARQETILEKTIFQKGINYHRAIIPMSHYFEWNKSKDRFSFYDKDSPILFVGGIFDLFDNQHRFTMITSQAHPSMADIHDRMPLILNESQLKDWLFDFSKAKDILKQDMPILERHATTQQQDMFDLL